MEIPSEIFSGVQLRKKKVCDLKLELSKLNLPQTGKLIMVHRSIKLWIQDNGTYSYSYM